MKLSSPINKFFGAVFAFIVLIFAVAQIWFPDMFQMDDFIKYAGTIAVFYAFVTIFAVLTSHKEEDTSAKSTDTEDKTS